MSTRRHVIVTAAVAALASVQRSSAGKFNCPPLTPPPAPRDITELHPAHVTVAMAVGDSITAAFSARNDLLEARDASWSIGRGGPEQLTLPYLMSQYSGEVLGASEKAVLPRDIAHLPHNDYHPETDHLNAAESSGAAHLGSLEEQWALLASNFGKYDNFDSRWKVLTIWMMANDVCGECGAPIETTQLYKKWESKTQEFLVNATSALKNTYINLISTLDLSQVQRIQRSTWYCAGIHKYLLNECGCIDKGTPEELTMLDRNVHYLNNRLHKFAADWRNTLQAQGRRDVAVVVQPFLEGAGSALDKTFLSELDCFHPAVKSHQDLAIGLWNSMLCTDGRQQRCGQPWTPDLNVTCPTETSVFYTGPDVIPDKWTPPRHAPSDFDGAEVVV